MKNSYLRRESTEGIGFMYVSLYVYGQLWSDFCLTPVKTIYKYIHSPSVFYVEKNNKSKSISSHLINRGN